MSVERSAPRGAVFLSYASQDAQPVRRIAEALRAAGVEVWFDQNELVGGDAWDAKIRGQIASCALFVPIISANTTARGEGYFRLEWKLAVDRSHLMAHDQPFLLPVVIDATADADARVPPEFRAVQWTRLRPVGLPASGGAGGNQAFGGQAPDDPGLAAFCARVKKLLGGSEGPTVGASLDDARGAVAQDGRGRATPLRRPSRAWRVPAIVGAAVVVVALAFWRPWTGAAKPGTASSRVSAPAASAPVSAARKLVAQARPLFDSGDYVNREDVFLAEDLLKKAQALDNTDAEVWAAQGDLSRQMFMLGYERTSSRFELLRQQSERAYKLDPNSTASQISYAGYLQWAGKASAQESARLMEALVSRVPDDRRAYRVLGIAWSYAGDIDKAMEACRRSNALPGGDPAALAMGAAHLQWWGRYAEIESTLAQADAVAVTGRSQVLRVLVDLFWRGDTDGAVASLQKWPLWMQREDRGAFVASQVWMWRREPDRAIAVLSPARDAFFDTYYIGPKAVLLALAHEMAGRPQAARAEWENAKRVATRMVAEQPSLKRALTLKALAMAKLGETIEAGGILRTLEQAGDLRSEYWSSAHPSALLRLTLGRADEVATGLATEANDLVAEPFPAPRAALQLNPVYDTVRATPAFQRLMAAAPAPASMRENASLAPVANDKSAPADKSLVVLPLENLSPDPENAFFTDGMHSEIIATLSRIPDLRVISRASALTLKGSALALGEAAKKIGVANVMTGSVRRAGPSVRIQLELRRASDEALLWSHTYAQELTDPLALQSDIAENVARALQARESRGAYGGARFSTKSPQAFDLFLKARGLWMPGDGNGEGMLRSALLLKEALGLDPGFVSAASVLATIFTDLARGSPVPDQRVIHAAEAKLYAEMAARLAPGGAGDAMLAFYYAAIEGEAAKALGLADNAIRALPNDAVHHNIRGIALRGLGRTAEALLSEGKARELDPLMPVFRGNELSTLVTLRRWDEFAAAHASDPGRGASAAARMHRAAYELKGELPTSLDGMSPLERRTWLWRGRKFAEADIELEQARAGSPVADEDRFALLCRHHDVLLRLGRADEAAKTAREAYEIAEKFQTVREVGLSNKAIYLARSLVRLGRNDEAIAAGRRYVEETSSTTQTGIRWRREAELAEIYAYAGRSREGVALLAKLLKEPVPGLTVPVLRLDPAWDNLRDDAAFKALLADPKNSAPL